MLEIDHLEPCHSSIKGELFHEPTATQNDGIVHVTSSSWPEERGGSGLRVVIQPRPRHSATIG
jgi:hypothetical protein